MCSNCLLVHQQKDNNKFIDSIQLQVVGGSGGNGNSSFLREVSSYSLGIHPNTFLLFDEHNPTAVLLRYHYMSTIDHTHIATI